MNRPPQTVSDLSEQGLLQRLQQFCPSEVVGDDGAVIQPTPGQLMVITSDMLVDGVHFSDRTTAPEDVGWRAAAANLSDLAAMGAVPLGITVSLGLKGEVAVDWVERLYQGLSQCLQTYNTPLVGGDICCSPVVTVAITAFGQVSPERVIRRSAARVGDAILVTGIHGASRAGLELLLHPETGQSLPTAVKTAWIKAHQRPRPRLDVLPLLWEVVGERAVAGMDSSDGLADAVVQICRASGVGAKVDQRLIPLPVALSEFVVPKQALEWVLYGGEDFELVLCLPTATAQALAERLGNGAAIIGEIVTGEEVVLEDSQGIHPPRQLTLAEGFQHF